MKYSEIKKRITILKKHNYYKRVGCLCYERVYSVNGWCLRQTISGYDIVHSKWMDGRQNLDDYLFYLYEKSMKTLLEYVIENNSKKINFK